MIKVVCTVLGLSVLLINRTTAQDPDGETEGLNHWDPLAGGGDPNAGGWFGDPAAGETQWDHPEPLPAEEYNPDDYQQQHTAWDPNLEIHVPVYYDANSFDPNDDFVNRTFLDYFFHTFISRTCDNEGIECNPSHPYRSVDGSCNNLDNPLWGAFNTSQSRFLDPLYEAETYPADNIPRKNGLPSARELSNEVHDAANNQHFSTKHSLSMVWFGQILSHDIVLTKQHEEPHDCCNETNRHDPRVFNIDVPGWDQYYLFNCLPFHRSMTATRGCFPDPENNPAEYLYKEINNFQSSYIDLSMTYGNTQEESDNLRDFSGGRLKSRQGPNGEDLLPNNTAKECPMNPDLGAYCQLTGDIRVDDVTYLGASHTLLLRAHNMIADALAALNNPGWDDEKLYQEARKINIAQFQHFVFHEYLKELLGVNLATNNLLLTSNSGFADEYDPTVNAGIFNEFAAAAMRMGHSQIPPHQAYLMPNHCLMDWYSIIENYKTSHMLYAYNGANLTEYARWMTWDKCMRADRFVEDEMRHWLFQGDDLVARNIQRGRDHAVNSYNSYRQFCGLAPVSFDDYIMLDHTWETTEKLKALYRYPDDIDLFVGGLAESPRGGSLLGPTFTCLMIKQFRTTKIGDRFFYERPGMFTEDQLNSIKQMTLAKLVCDTYNVPTIQGNIFQLGYYNNENPLVNCSSLPSIDFDLWRI